MIDFLDVLAHDAIETIDSGYYKTVSIEAKPQVSLRNAILECKHNAVITEIKAASPTAGIIRKKINPKQIAESMQRGGAVGISVLTEPKHFNGSLQALSQTRQAIKLPILMKDIIISPTQIEIASQLGAQAVLFIQALFDRRYTKMAVDEMVTFAHSKGLEVLLETHTGEELDSAMKTDADLIGINNRNLRNLQVDLTTTREMLEKNKNHSKLVISESGILKPKDLQFVRSCGAKGFLIGSAIMLTNNIEERVKEFVYA